ASQTGPSVKPNPPPTFVNLASRGTSFQNLSDLALSANRRSLEDSAGEASRKHPPMTVTDAARIPSRTDALRMNDLIESSLSLPRLLLCLPGVPRLACNRRFGLRASSLRHQVADQVVDFLGAEPGCVIGRHHGLGAMFQGSKTGFLKKMEGAIFGLQL